MRRLSKIGVLFLSACILAGCSQAQAQPEPSSVVKQEAVDSSEGEADETEQEVDVDLTQLSSVMCYSEVYTMITYPEQYWGKTVKMSGEMAYSMSTGEQPQYYFAVLIADALACCQQGIEFVLENGSGDPADYPAIGSQVTVVGEFTSYEEEGMTYCRLVSAKVLPQEEGQ